MTARTDRRGALPRLLMLLRPERFRLVVVGLFGVLSVGLVLTGPVFLGQATNLVFDGLVGRRLTAGHSKAEVIVELRAQGHSAMARLLSAMDIVPGVGIDYSRLGRVLGFAALAYLLSVLFGWAQGYVMAGAAQRVVYQLRQSVEDKLAGLPLRYFDRNQHGDTLSRVTNDIDNVATTLNEAFSPLLTSVFTVLGALGVMFWLSPVLATVSMITIPLTIVLTGGIARRSKRHFVAQWTRTGQLNGLVEETHTAHLLVQAYGREQAVIDEFGRQNDELFESSFRAQFLSGVVLPAVTFVGNLNYVVIAAVGGYQVATGAITLGAVQAVIQYARRFTIPVAQLAGQLNLLQSGLASAERVFAFLDVPEEPATHSRVDLADGPDAAAPAVELRGVSFRYDPDRPLIEDFTLAVPPGSTVAIVGPTGAGKTTLVNLLMRFYEIDAGQILLGGADYRDLGRDEVRGRFGMVLQDTWLFGGTIGDNIGYGRPGADENEIVAAAVAAHADDFIRTLPAGYATVLDGEASVVSAGERQLLTIARAFLADPGILILDEATSNVDTRTEAKIQDAMLRLWSGRTSFVIAHRLSTIRAADMIVVMDGGRVVEQGTHDELLRGEGLYRSLHDSQFGDAPEQACQRNGRSRRGLGAIISGESARR
jgi:ABC-type multidrug transport system fused ATPase/permease subunit